MEFVIWLIFCVAVGCFANQKGKNPVMWGLLSLFISPLLAGIALALSKDEKVQEEITRTRFENQQLRDRVAINEANTNARFESIGTSIHALQSNVNRTMLQVAQNNAMNNQAQRFSMQGQNGNIDIENKLNACRSNLLNQNTQVGVPVEENVKICPFCHEKIKSGAIICRYCGADLQSTRMMECPFCKELIPENSVKCKYCNSDISQNSNLEDINGNW